jgi:DNA polymerase I-like protein with 3'-5' exonuclease and polymerase domains/uracil-DNA glycosylase
LISGHGASNPSVMLVADYAQGEDLKTNYALSGFKENLLRQFCKNANLNYNGMYRTCLIKDDLPKLDGEKISKKTFNNESEYAALFVKRVVPQYASILRSEIESLQPNLIIPLGEIGFQHLSGLAGIRKFRGSVLKLDARIGIERYTKLLPILGPYPYLYSDHKQKFITQLDFNKVQKWQGNAPIPDDTFRIWIARTSNSLRNFIDRCYPVCAAKTVETGGFLVFDIESYMNIPTCISFCFDGFESCCVPFLDPSIDLDQRVLMIDLTAKLLNSPIPKVNQNIKYDWKTLERWLFRVSNVVGDTMLAAATLYCEFPKNLGFLTSIYTDLPYFKDEGRQFDPSKHKKEQFYLYNAKDSLSTHQIYSKQIPETMELGVSFVYKRLIQLIPVYRRMEDRGIRIDEAARDSLLAKYQSLFRIHSLTLNRLLSTDNLNPLSAPAMNQVVFDELGYKKIRGVKGTDEESLNMLMAFGEPEHATAGTGKEILQQTLWCRKIHKVIEIASLALYPDGRFRCEFNLAGTETGRTSAGKTTDYFFRETFVGKNHQQKVKTINLGHSLQTIGKHGFYINGELYGTDIRNMFVPSVGYSFVEIDLSGAEARVDRVLSGNFDMGVFDNPGIHKLTGSWVFNCQPSDIKKGTLQYHLSKTVRHAGERNMQANRFFLMAQDEGTGVNLTLKDAERILKDFHKAEPGIKNVYHRDIIASIRSNQNLVCPNGRRRDFFDRIDHHAFNEGISFVPQAIVSDQTKFSFLQTFEKAPWAHLLDEAHDGSLAEVPKSHEMEYYKIYKDSIETPIDFRQGSLKRDYQLTIPCEAESSCENWGNLEKLEL